MFYLQNYHEVSKHDNDIDLFLPDHPPHIIDGTHSRCLRSNKTLFSSVVPDVRSIDII